MASLIITSGEQEGRFYPLGRRTNVIGRDEALLIQIQDSALRHYRKTGERMRVTSYEPRESISSQFASQNRQLYASLTAKSACVTV